MQTEKTPGAAFLHGYPSLSHTKTLVVTAMFVVLVYFFTNIGFPIFGIPGSYTHLGNVPLFVCCIFFGKRMGAIAGGIGMALFDVLSPYAAWAPFTLVIGILVGFIVGLVAENSRSVPALLLAFLLAAVLKVGGYFIADGLILGNWVAPVASVPANLLQVVVGAVIALAILKPLQVGIDRILMKERG